MMGNRDLSLSILVKLARALKVSVGDLVEQEDLR
jgi:DNA-binding Xre family transcriptional regulator